MQRPTVATPRQVTGAGRSGTEWRRDTRRVSIIDLRRQENHSGTTEPSGREYTPLVRARALAATTTRASRRPPPTNLDSRAHQRVLPGHRSSPWNASTSGGADTRPMRGSTNLAWLSYSSAHVRCDAWPVSPSTSRGRRGGAKGVQICRVRALSVTTRLDHTTLAAHPALRSEDDPLIDLIENDRGLQGDLHQLRIPDEIADRAARVAWRPGKLHARCGRCSGKLGHPAASCTRRWRPWPRGSWRNPSTPLAAGARHQSAAVAEQIGCLEQVRSASRSAGTRGERVECRRRCGSSTTTPPPPSSARR